jgi:hypothetical protein
MATETIYFLVFAIAVSPIIWWLVWRDDFDRVQSQLRFEQERQTREPVFASQFYDHYYQGSDLDRDVVNRFLSLCADQWSIDAALIRPTDNYFRIYDADAAVFFDELKYRFGIEPRDGELENIDGSFDSLARYVDRRVKQRA